MSIARIALVLQVTGYILEGIFVGLLIPKFIEKYKNALIEDTPLKRLFANSRKVGLPLLHVLVWIMVIILVGIPEIALFLGLLFGIVPLWAISIVWLIVVFIMAMRERHGDVIRIYTPKRYRALIRKRKLLEILWSAIWIIFEYFIALPILSTLVFLIETIQFIVVRTLSWKYSRYVFFITGLACIITGYGLEYAITQ